jgi:acetoin utilization protein AcuC
VLNLAVPARINDEEFLLIVRELCRRKLVGLTPDAVVVTCGADALKGDPLSSMHLSNVALWAATEAVISLSERVVVLGGGGYNPWTTARLWAGLWGRLSGQSMPPQLPAAARRVLAGLSCDLVDDDDYDPAWLTSIADARNPGPIRARIHDLIDQVVPVVDAR